MGALNHNTENATEILNRQWYVRNLLGTGNLLLLVPIAHGTVGCWCHEIVLSDSRGALAAVNCASRHGCL